MLVLIQHIIMLIFKWLSFIFCYEFKISNSQNQLFSLPSFRVQSRNLPCTLLFLAPFAKGFPFSAVSHRTLYRCARKIEGFARDDVTEVAFSQHIRCTLREINPFSPTVISSAARNLPCTLLFLASFAEGFPFPAVAHMALYQCARKIPRLRLG